MSNLLKRANVINKDERVIDYNQLINEKIEALKLAAAAEENAGFVEGLHSPKYEQLLDEDGNPIDMSVFGDITGSEEGTDDGTAQPGDGVHIQEAAPDLNEIKAQADAIIAEAKEEADRIKADAAKAAQDIRSTAQSEGLAQGREEAGRELDSQRARLEDEYAGRQSELEDEYAKRRAQMEPELADVILEVVSNAVCAISESDKNIILSLINRVLENTNISNEFVIKVSPEDYDFIINNQGKLYCAMNKEIQADIAEDDNLTKNQCLVETDSGVYDCSLDIQLENLIKTIKLLSCCD